MNIVDTHCHLYLPEFRDDIEHVIARARAAGVNRFYLPAIDSTVNEELLALEKSYPGECFAMMGLHPCSVKENYKEELSVVESFVKQRKFVAVGEIGLDFYWDKTFLKEQYGAFEFQLQMALDYRLPVSIHTRNAIGEAIGMVRPFAEKGLKGAFHCFGGSYEHALEITRFGFHLGIGGVLTYKNSGLKEVLANIDLSHVVLETDAPYLTPVPYRGKRNESSYLGLVVRKLAEIKGVAPEEVAAITTSNAKKIFGN